MKKIQKKKKHNPYKLNLGQFIASQTPMARRKVMELLTSGRILVNGTIATDITTPIIPNRDIVTVDGKALSSGLNLVYYKFFKPGNVICTLHDPKGRRTIKDYTDRLTESVFPVGRLDRPTKGLILLTNDGALAHRILHPSHELTKVYEVQIDLPISKDHLARLTSGFFLDDGPVIFQKVVSHTRTELTVTITEGRNRIIRRAFAFFGYDVKKLVRTHIGPITLEGVKEGRIEPLTKKELEALDVLITQPGSRY
ncbi:MAG: pseudouridine synthase [bacterium]|nr:pseudouridine synthase [bacterium]